MQGLSEIKICRLSIRHVDWRIISFERGAVPLYLTVYKVVMLAACSVRQRDFCTMLQFIGQRADKWIPPSPPAPNVSMAGSLEGRRPDLGTFSREQ